MTNPDSTTQPSVLKTKGFDAFYREHLAWTVGYLLYKRCGAIQRLSPLAMSNDASYDRVEETDAAERLTSKLLDELNMPLHRQALKMYFEEGHDYATMAKILGETPAAMRKRVNDGLRYLRRILDTAER